jgi:heavy metal sensor kinase
MKPLQHLPIRARITLGHMAALLVLLAGFAIGIYEFFRQEAYARLDQRLRDDYELVEHSLHRDADGRVVVRVEIHEATTPEERLLVEIWDHARPEVLWRQGAGDGPDAAFPGPPAGRQEVSTTGVPAMRVREGVEAVGGGFVRVRVARTETSVRSQLARLRLALGVGLMVGVCLAGLAGYLLAGRALAPVAQMAARAGRIGAENLHERLPLPNPNDELGRLGGVFNQTLARLQRSFAQLRQFTSDASHELRTPLTALRAVGEVALGQPRQPAEYRETIGSMLEEADRLSRLVDSLLLLARADAGQVPLLRKTVDLVALAREVGTQLGALSEERDQRIAIHADGPVPVSADSEILRRAVVNLIDNAIKHAPLGSAIDVRVGHADAGPTLAVTDAGPGIAREHQARIFDRFYRVDPGRARDAGGTGLGLAIAKWSVEAHGGTIEVESDPGNGSTFRIVLPKHRAPPGSGNEGRP